MCFCAYGQRVIVALISQKGGVGKSTLALGLAWEWMSLGSRVLLVDADAQRTCLEACARAEEGGHSPPTTIHKEKELHRPNQIPALSRSYDVTVIDTPGRLGDVLRAALAIADVALVLVSPSGPDAWAVRDTVEVVKRAQELRDGLHAALVVTRRIPRSRLGSDAQGELEQLGLPVFSSSTCNRTAWAEASTAGLGVTKYAPQSTAAEELRGVLNEVTRFSRGESP